MKAPVLTLALAAVASLAARKVLAAVVDDPAGTPETVAFARAGLEASSGR